MPHKLLSQLACFVVGLAALVAAGGPGHAQGNDGVEPRSRSWSAPPSGAPRPPGHAIPPKSAKPNGTPPQAVPPGPSGKAKAAQRSAKKKAPALRTDTPAARAKVLANLYAHLATAEDEAQAIGIAEAIERIWLDSGSDTVSVLMERALKVANEKRLDLALKLLDTVITLKPDFVEGFNRRAYVYYLQDNVEGAMGDLRRVLALEPNHYKALDGLAQILREAGDKKSALKAYKQLQLIHPNWQGLAEQISDLEREIEGQRI